MNRNEESSEDTERIQTYSAFPTQITLKGIEFIRGTSLITPLAESDTYSKEDRDPCELCTVFEA